MDDKIYSFKGYIQTPRWTNPKTFLAQLCWLAKVDYEITDDETGWLTRTLFYTIKGPKEGIDLVQKYMEEWEKSD